MALLYRAQREEELPVGHLNHNCVIAVNPSREQLAPLGSVHWRHSQWASWGLKAPFFGGALRGFGFKHLLQPISAFAGGGEKHRAPEAGKKGDVPKTRELDCSPRANHCGLWEAVGWLLSPASWFAFLFLHIISISTTCSVFCCSLLLTMN